MKKYILPCLFLIAGNMLTGQSSSQFNCVVRTNTAVSSRSTCFTPGSYTSAPEMTLNVNMHILPNSFASANEAVTAAKKLLDDMNTILSSLAAYKIDQTVTPTNIDKSKIKCKFYSEPSNSSDIYGGIWLYSQGQIPTYRYGANVLNVELYSVGSNAISGSSGIGTGGNSFDATDFFGNRNSAISGFPLVVVHELGHRLGLHHPEYCMNECAGVDINAALECSSNCPSLYTCSPTSTRNNGNGPSNINPCGGPGNLCVNSCNRSNLLTSGCFEYPRAMTPCQWALIFNDVLGNNPGYARLCPTATSFTLPTSPLNDYRATGLITSTSLIAAGRMVDYWANTVQLNAGFSAQLGSTFVAGTSSFPCCTSIFAAPSSSERTTPDSALSKVILDINDENDIISSYPNPFSGNITISLAGATNASVAEADLVISDVQGKTIYSGKINANGEVSIPTQSWEKGIYSLKVISGDKIWSRKLIHL